MNVFVAASLLAMAALPTTPESNRSSVRTVPVARTPEGTAIQLAIALPQKGQVLNNPVWVQFRIDGYALGAGSSQFDRADEIAVSDMGQTVHVVVDNYPYFPIAEPAIDPFLNGEVYSSMSYKFEIPYRLGNGMHTIRIFPARSYGESLKGETTMATGTFYIGNANDNPDMDLSKPFLTYNEPSNELYLTEEKPILLDFCVSNAELSPDGYKVRLSIDGRINRTITSWQPYYIMGLKRGKHTISLELLDAENEVVPGHFNFVTRTITVH